MRFAKSLLRIRQQLQFVLALSLLAVFSSACAVSRTRHIARIRAFPPPHEASVAQLVSAINLQSGSVHSLTATVDLAPSTGSTYSGVIKQYHDVRGFILAERPAWIRVVGQAPVVRTDIFDMASDGRRFSLYIPSQNKFYVGPAALGRHFQNSLENLRPQHILDALLLQPLDPAHASYFAEEAEEGEEQYYVVSEISGSGPGLVELERKIWFDRSNLQISRVELYGSGGKYLEDVRYSDYRDFDGLRYPAQIAIRRPVEDYSLTIKILNARFNAPLPASKFTLKRPASAQQIDVGLSAAGEAARGR
ncbi:MAG: outer membrane lipoprotein-sorting protein [Terriglobia bacterium]